MAEELQHLIERIRKEGVESGEKAADALVAEAKKKAAAIVAEAQKQAKELAEKADKDAAAFAERGKKTLEQAARDLLISIGGSVGDVVGGIVDAKVGAALTPELMAQMLLKLAEAYGKDGGAGGIVAMLGEADAAAVKAAFAKEYQNKLAAGHPDRERQGNLQGLPRGREGRAGVPRFHQGGDCGVAGQLPAAGPGADREEGGGIKGRGWGSTTIWCRRCRRCRWRRRRRSLRRNSGSSARAC